MISPVSTVQGMPLNTSIVLLTGNEYVRKRAWAVALPPGNKFTVNKELVELSFVTRKEFKIPVEAAGTVYSVVSTPAAGIRFFC